MSTKKHSRNKWVIAVAFFGLFLVSSVMILGQSAPPQPHGVPDDWTHHHVIFSDPGTAADALAKGRLAQWNRIVTDQRYIIQQRKRHHKPVPPTTKSPLHRDWSMNMGAISATQTGTVTTNNASNSSTITVDGVTFTASNSIAATQTGTFSSVPNAYSAPITIVNGSNTLTLTTNATGANATGTFVGAPTASTSITVTNVTLGNTLTMTTNATSGSTNTGTFSGIPTTATTATIQYGVLAQLLTLTGKAGTTGTIKVETMSLSTTTGSNQLTVGSVTYTFSATSCGATANCIYLPSGYTTTTGAKNIEAAINATASECGNPAGNGCFGTSTVANPQVTATETSLTVTVRNVTGAAVAMSETETSANLLLSTASIATASVCASATVGTFTLGVSTAGSASNLAAAINSCNTSFPAIGATASYTSGSSFTVTQSTLGVATYSGSGLPAGVFAWGTASGGSVGSASCTGSSSPFTGTFATASTIAALAQNMVTAIGDCSNSLGITAAYTGNGTTGVFKAYTMEFDAAAATITTGGAVAGNFTWGASAAGTTGTANACTGNTTANFKYNATLSTQTTDLKDAINLCTASVTGVTATSSGTTLTLTANAAGSNGNSIALSPTTSGYFEWNGADLAGGSGGTTTATNFGYWGGAAPLSTTQVAANIATAINLNLTLQVIGGVSATSNSNVVTLIANSTGTVGNSISLSEAAFSGFAWGAGDLSGGTSGGGTVGAGIYPAKYAFYDASANCDDTIFPDYVVYNTGLAGSATQPTIVGYDNLYSGCPTTSVPVPNVYWQYYTGGTITTNSVLSEDGTQVAFVQINASNQAQLVMLKWDAGYTMQSLTSVASGADYASCTAPCMYAITFDSTGPGIPTDTYSSPFYDYNDDAIYVGDDNGYLHQFSGVFLGVPAEVTSGGFPVSVSTAPLSSPVYDFGSTLVFVGPATGANGSIASMYSITTSGPMTVTASAPMGAAGGAYIFADAPLVDPSAEMVYAFTNDDVAGTNAAVWQIPALFTADSLGTEAALGLGSTANPMYIGAFDNIYNSNSGPVGNLYVMAPDAASQEPALWLIPINTTMGTPVEIGAQTTAATLGSPITEFYNASTTTDYIFLSVQASASPAGCGGAGCIMSFTVTTPLLANATPTATLAEAGGTSGIIVDNEVTSGTLAGASQIYFSPLGSQSCTGNSAYSIFPAGTAGVGTGGCAIQASQSGLD